MSVLYISCHALVIIGLNTVVTHKQANTDLQQPNGDALLGSTNNPYRNFIFTTNLHELNTKSKAIS